MVRSYLLRTAWEPMGIETIMKLQYTRWWFWIFSMFTPIWNKIPISTNIFQMGWNRQPVVIYPFFVLMVWILEVCFAYIHQGGEMWVFSVFKIYSWSQTKLGFDLRCASQGSKWIIWVTQYLSGRDWAKTNKINSLSKFQGLLYVFSLDSLSWWFCFFGFYNGIINIFFSTIWGIYLELFPTISSTSKPWSCLVFRDGIA